MTIEKREYSKLVSGDKCLIQNYNGKMGTLTFKAKVKTYVCWETDEGNEVWDDIEYLVGGLSKCK